MKGFILFIVSVTINCINEETVNLGKTYHAQVALKKDPAYEGQDISGTIYLTQVVGQLTYLNGVIYGLTDGDHGIHVHAQGNVANSCGDAGSHYNPFNVTHGGPNDMVRHYGDLGNIKSQDGIADINTEDLRVDLFGTYSVIGRSVVVHALQDDLGKGGKVDSNTTGSSGARIACGTITLIQQKIANGVVVFGKIIMSFGFMIILIFLSL